MTREELENEAECATMQREHLGHLRRLVETARHVRQSLDSMRLDPDLRKFESYIELKIERLDDALAYYSNLH